MQTRETSDRIIVGAADASVIPTLISGNTNAIAMMIGERAADFIRAGSPA